MTSKITNIDVNTDIKPYLDDIAEKLWTNHATIMVGAGFSKNASNDFPNWNELGDVFYKKLHGEKPTPSQVRYCNVLKLADSVEATFGRNTLNHILTSEIPNALVEPVELHHTLLSLPWVDVFTTNYDTLLEKATKKVTTRRYDVVLNSNELVYSTSPRIIKLHGSFPSSVPFIITEEDYRKYPYDFSPFVNTVQQSLLENTLCLIGFSGDDPNFLKWIGWIRDNLGQHNSPKIFLIGLFDFSCADLKLLEKRNIIVIDMSSCSGIEPNQHGDALQRFFDYLKSKNNNTPQLNWPVINNIQPDRRNKENKIEKQLELFIDHTEIIKNNYPGWLIAPRKSRARLSSFINEWSIFIDKNNSSDLDLDLKIKFLSNLTWCLNICLTPIYDNIAEIISDIESNIKEINENKLIGNLYLTLARYYREEFKWDKWELITKKISNLNYLKDNLCYEICLSHLYRGNLYELRSELESWIIKSTSPQWMIKKSSLLSEIGESDLAENIAQESLNIIRRNLNLTPIKNDVTLLSLESYAMLLLHYENRSLTKDTDFYTDRWNTLKLYQCDPWGELEFLSLSLNNKYDYSPTTTITPSFNIGEYKNTTKFSSINNDNYVINALNLLRFYEDAGLPITTGSYRLSSNSLNNGLVAISYYYPFWAYSTSIRVNDDKAIDALCNRRGLTITQNNILNTMAKAYLDTLKKLEKSSFENQQKINRRFSENIPKLLYKLISKIDFYLIKDIYEYFCSNFEELNIKYHQDIVNIFNYVSKVTSNSQHLELLHFAIKCRCPKNIINIITKTLTPPIWTLDLSEINDYTLDDDDLNYLISLMISNKEHEKHWGLLSIIKLFNAKILSEKQSENFRDILWYNVEDNNLPKIDDILISAYYSLPNKLKVDNLNKVIKDAIFSLEIPIQGDNNTYTNLGNNIKFFIELFNSKNNIELNVNEITSLTKKLIDWWNTDKKNLEDEDTIFFYHKADDFKRRFSCLIETLTYFILPKITKKNIGVKLETDILLLVEELKYYNFTVTSLYIANKRLFKKTNSDISNEICNGILSNNEETTILACNTLLYWLTVERTKSQKECVNLLIMKLLTNSSFGIKTCTKVLRIIFEKHNYILDDNMINNITKSLLLMKEGSEFKETDTDITLAKKLELRIEASKFSNLLYNDINTTVKNKEELFSWFDILESNFEFNEIKRFWI